MEGYCMKKLLFLICAVIMLSGVNASAAQKVFEENFESYSEGYDMRLEKGKKIYSNVQGDVNVVKRDENDLCLEFDRTTTNTKFDMTMGYNLTRNNKMRGYMVYEWDFMQKEYANDQRMIILCNVMSDSLSTVGTKNSVKIKTDNGCLMYDAGTAGWIKIADYNEKEWYRIKVELDFQNSLYNIYINGEKKFKEPISCYQNSRGAYNVALQFGGNSAGSYYVDNIRIFTFDGRDYSFSEDFEAYEDGFNLTTDEKGKWSQAVDYSGALCVKNINGNNAAYIKRGTAGATLEKRVENPDSTGTVMTVEWDFMKTEKSSEQRVFVNAGVNGSDKRITCIRTTQSGDIEFCSWGEEGEVWHKIVDQYITNRWYNFRVVLNTNSLTQTSGKGTFDIYVDSVAYQPQKPLQSYQDIRTVQPTNIALQFKNMAVGEFYIDNIKMYRYSMDKKPNLINNNLYYTYDENTEKINLEADIVNMEQEDYDIMYLTAVYNEDGTLEAVRKDEAVVYANDIHLYKTEFDTSSVNVGKSSIVKMYLWKNGELKPFDDAVTIVGPDNTRPDYAYLVLGQSNMAYRGQYGDEPSEDTPEGLYLFNNTTDKKQWKWKIPINTTYSMEREMNADGEFTGIGLPYTFGVAMQEYHDKNVGLIDCAVGGVSIDYYTKGVGEGYTRAVERALYAKSMGVELKGIIWHQGESERTSGRTEVAKNYATILNGVIENLRHDIGEPDLPVIVGEIGYFVADYPQSVNVETVNEQIRSVPDVISNSGAVTAEGLYDRGDGMHFTPDAQEEYGRRYADAMIKLLEEE